MNDKIDEVLLKIMKKSESIGRWTEFLSKLEDWSSVYVVIGQNNIKKFEKERNEYIEELKKIIKENNK